MALADYAAVAADHKWSILAAAFLMLVLGGGYFLIAPPVYVAEAVLQVEGKGRSDANQGYAGSLGYASAVLGGQARPNTGETAAEIESLRSWTSLEDVVANLRLDVEAEPAYFPLGGRFIANRRGGSAAEPAPPMLGLNGYAWGGEAITVDAFDVPPAYLDERFQLTALGDRRYRIQGPDGAVVLEGAVGQRAEAELGGETLALLVADLRARPGTVFRLRARERLSTVRELRKALHVSERVPDSGVIEISLAGSDPARVARIINEVADAALRANVGRKARDAEDALEIIERQLPDVKRQLEVAETALNEYRLAQRSVNLDKEAEALLQKRVAAESRLTEMRQEREDLTRRFAPAHPMVVTMDAQIRRLSDEIAQMGEAAQQLPLTQQEVLRLTRDVEANSQLYITLMKNAQDLRLAQVGAIGSLRLINPALAADEPVKPRASVVLSLSLVLGLLLGATLVFGRRMLSGNIEDPELIERRLSVPVLTTIGHSDEQRRLSAGLTRNSSKNLALAARSPDDPALEAVRRLATMLRFSPPSSENDIIMLTGPNPQSGKSFISVNLATVLANAGERVLLVDGDLRKGSLHHHLGVDPQPGLSELIGGTCKREEAVRGTEVDGLDVIARGQALPNPVDLWLRNSVEEHLSELAREYDRLIIDAPPVLDVTDPSIIGRFAGATFLVAKLGSCSLKDVESSTRLLLRSGVNVDGVLINGMSVQQLRRYGHSYGYRYQ